MESQAPHKRDMSLIVYWAVVGIGIGIVIGASTAEWGVSLSSGVLMGGLMAMFATKPGVDQ